MITKLRPRREVGRSIRRAMGARASATVLATLWCLHPAPARADVDVFFEDLTDTACDYSGCAENGGLFVDTVGWQVQSADSQMLFDITGDRPEGVACGSFSVELTHFDPVTNMHGDTGSVHFAGLFEGPHLSTWTAAANDEAQIQISGKCEVCTDNPAPNKQQRFEFLALLCSWDWDDQNLPWCGGNVEANRYVPGESEYAIDWTTTLDLHYVTTVTWDCAGLGYEVHDGTNTWTSWGTWEPNPGHPHVAPRFRYVSLGRDNKPQENWIGDMILVNARLTEHSDCDCPNADAGTPDAGAPDAEAQDAAMDSGVGYDAARDGSAPDGQAPDGGGDDPLGTCGCSCRSGAGGADPGGMPVLIVLLALLVLPSLRRRLRSSHRGTP